MILYDSSAISKHPDYGIMIPVKPDKGIKVLEFLGGTFPVLDFVAAKALLKIDGHFFSREDLERIHCKKYIAKLYGNELKTELLKNYELIDVQGNFNRYEPEKAIKPLEDMFQTLFTKASGTYLACLLAREASLHKARETTLQNVRETTFSDKNNFNVGFCYYLGGGMHHARYDAPSGFCLINDITAAAFKLLAEKSIQLIWIIDLDAHKGDGTAELVSFARDRGELCIPQTDPLFHKSSDNISNNYFIKEKPCILTLSIHMAKGWPLDNESLALAETGRAPLIPSDVDIGIDSGEEAEYTARLASGIRKLENLSGRNPDFVLVEDGADPYEHDSLPSASLMRLTLEQCVERDIWLYRYLQEHSIPSAWVQGGGYGERAWEPSAHFLRSIQS